MCSLLVLMPKINAHELFPLTKLLLYPITLLVSWLSLLDQSPYMSVGMSHVYLRRAKCLLGVLCLVNFGQTTLSLSVTKSASATDRRFPATLLHACVFLSQSTHPFHPAHARCGDLSFCRFTDLRTASVPAFQPAQTFMTCLTQSGPCCFFFFFFFFFLKY